jgi:hypothetical protein
MGSGRAPGVADIRRASVLSAAVGLVSAVAAVRVADALGSRRRTAG